MNRAREWELRMMAFIGGQMSVLSTAVARQMNAISEEEAEAVSVQYVGLVRELMGDILAKDDDTTDGPRVEIH